MTVREYLKNCNKYADVTFIKARARKDVHTPGYHAEYQTTPNLDGKINDVVTDRNTLVLLDTMMRYGIIARLTCKLR